MLLPIICAAAVAAGPVPPRTPKKPVTLEYGRVKATDDYLWLEKDSDPRVKQWSDQQNAVARAFLEGAPGREALHKRMEKLIRSSSESFQKIVDRRGALAAAVALFPNPSPLRFELAPYPRRTRPRPMARREGTPTW